MNRTLLQVLLAFSLVAMPARAAESVSLYPIQIIAGSPGGGDDVGQYSRLAHDPAGGQHVVYYDATYSDLKYAHRMGLSQPWTIEVVDSQDGAGRWCALAIGATSQTSGTCNVVNGSRTVELTTGTMPTSVVAGGGFRLEPGGTWQNIASVDPDHRRFDLVNPYTGPSASNAPFTIRYWQPTISYQGKTSYGSTLRIAKPGNAGAWDIADVDPPTTPTTSHTGFETGIAIDSAGRIHVVYQDRTSSGSVTGLLRYAKFDGASWTFQYPLQGQSVSGADRICLDATDNVWLFCRNSTGNQLVALQGSSGSWVPATLDSTGHAGLAIDAVFSAVDNTIFVSSQNRPDGSDHADIKLSEGTSSGIDTRDWSTAPIGAAMGNNGDYTAIAHGAAAGTQQLLYYDSLTRRLLMLRPTSPGASEYGTPLVVDAGADVGRYCSASVNPIDDALYAAYYDARGMALKMARNNWTSDSTTTYIDGIKAGMYSDIGFTATEVIAAYYNATEGNLHVARWPKTGIPSDGTDVVVDATSSNVGEYVSMAIGKDGRIFLAYYDRANTNLRFAAWNLSEWSTTLINNTSQNVGEYCRVVIDSAGTKLALAWRDADQLAVSYAIANIPAIIDNAGDFAWTTTTFGVNEEIGRYLSIAFDASSQLHLAYFSDKLYAPMYALAGTSATMTTETIEYNKLNVAGWFTSIAIGTLGQPAVAYHDVTHGSLKYAERTGDQTWAITTLTDKGDTGYYPVLRFDPVTNEQYVVYYDHTGNTLMVRSKPIAGTTWRDPLTLASGTRGIRPAVSIDADGRFYMSFYHQLGGDLLYMNPEAPPIFNAAESWQKYR